MRNISFSPVKNWNAYETAPWVNKELQKFMFLVTEEKVITAIFKNMNDICECIGTSRNFSFNAICKEQPLNRIDKLLATTANYVLCLRDVWAGSLKRFSRW